MYKKQEIHVLDCTRSLTNMDNWFGLSPYCFPFTSSYRPVVREDKERKPCRAWNMDFSAVMKALNEDEDQNHNNL